MADDAKEGKQSLELDEILVAEFEYIAQSAFQAHEDRARVTTFYLVSVGSFLAAVLGAQVDVLDTPFYVAFAALFLVLSVMGWLTLLQLVRLRLAWFESVKAMNTVKDFYVERNRELAAAFRWRMDTMPPPFKPESVAYLLAIQVSLLSAGMLGAAAVFVELAFGLTFEQDPWLLLVGVGAGVIYYVVQMNVHRSKLGR